jgi:hypothetical protein
MSESMVMNAPWIKLCCSENGDAFPQQVVGGLRHPPVISGREEPFDGFVSERPRSGMSQVQASGYRLPLRLPRGADAKNRQDRAVEQNDRRPDPLGPPAPIPPSGLRFNDGVVAPFKHVA